MFTKRKFKLFDKDSLSSNTTPHEGMMTYTHMAFDKKWIITAGKNIIELEKIAAEKSGVKYTRCATVRPLFIFA